MDHIRGSGLAVVGLQQRVEESRLPSICQAHQVNITFVLPGPLKAGDQGLHTVPSLGADQVDVGQLGSEACIVAALSKMAPDSLKIIGRVHWKKVNLVTEDNDAFVGPDQLWQVRDDGVRDVQQVYNKQHQSFEGVDFLNHGPVLFWCDLEVHGLMMVGEQVAALACGPCQTSLAKENLEFLTRQVSRHLKSCAVQNSATAWTAGITERLIYVWCPKRCVFTLLSSFLFPLLCGYDGIIQGKVNVVELY